MEQTTQTTETSYTYQHASGEIVSVGSFEEALGKCAVLGAEDTPEEEARLMFNMYARGMEVQKEQAAEESNDENEEADQAEQFDRSESVKEVGQKKEEPAKKSNTNQVRLEAPFVAADTKPKQTTAKNETFNERGGATQPATTESFDRTGDVSNNRTESALADQPTTTAKASKEFTDSGVTTLEPGSTVTQALERLLPSLKEQVLPEARMEEEVIIEDLGDIDPVGTPKLPIALETALEAEIVPEELLIEIAETDSFSEEVIEPEAEVLEESEPFEADKQWTSDEVLQLRDLVVINEADAESVLSETEDRVGVLEVLPVEQVEQTILELVERIEAIDDEDAETVFDILDEIAIKVETIITPLRIMESGKVETDQEDGKLDQAELEVLETEVQEELKELFVELFDYVGMEYTPELIEAFIKLALEMDISKLVPKVELVEKSGTDPGQGTHEIIKQLLGALTIIKQAAERAYAIGKSVLLLYRYQLAAV